MSDIVRLPRSAPIGPLKTIHAIVQSIRRDDLDHGVLASLRRGGVSAVILHPNFHRLLARFEPTSSFDDARRWGAIVHATALGARIVWTGNLLPSGSVLAEAKLSEARFVKILATGGDALRDQVAMLARYLAAKNHPFIGIDLCELLLHEGRWEKRSEELRFQIARDFYRVPAAATEAKTPNPGDQA